MIKAHINKHYLYVFRRYIDFIMRSDFHEVKVIGEWKSEGRSSLIIGNHISWWDGFWGLYVNDLFLKKNMYCMMLEEQLAARKILTKMGAFSIKPGTRDVVESLSYAAALLDDTKNSVLMFPQGKINSRYNPNFGFERGIEKLIEMKPGTQVLFFATFVDYFSNRKPTLFFYLKEMTDEDKDGNKNIQQIYQVFYGESLKHQSQLTS